MKCIRVFGCFAHGFDIRCLFPWIPGLLITFPGVIQRFSGKRRGTHKVRLVAGAVIQCLLMAALARPGGSVPARIFCGLLLLIYCAVFLFDYRFFHVMWHPPGEDIMVLGMRERHNLWTIARDYLSVRDLGIAIVMALAVLLPMLLPLPSTSPHWWPVVGVLGLGILAILGRRGPPPGETLGSICRAARHAPKIWKATRKAKARKRRRNPFPGSRPSGPPKINILTIINESLSRCHMYGEGGDIIDEMPHLQAFLREQAANVFQFPFAITNSTASDVSYPTILTGVSPAQEWKYFDSNPLIWAAAKKAGYHTAFYSGWNTNWWDLNYMTVDKHVDRFVDPFSLSSPIVNNMGMDDRILTRHFTDYLKTVTGPFFTLLAYNAQHVPCLVDPANTRHDLSTTMGRYRNSLTLIDNCLKEIFDTLGATGQLANTAIFFLSDHGELPANFDKPREGDPDRHHRFSDFCQDLLSVPFWMYLPEGAAAAPEIAALRGNQSRIVSNLDYFPTALATMGIRLKPAHTLELKLAGHDLFQPLPGDRLVPCRNTGIFHDWKFSPVALAAGPELLIYHDIGDYFELRDIHDPLCVNRWSGISPEQRAVWMQRLVKTNLDNDRQAKAALEVAPMASGDESGGFHECASALYK